MACDLSFNRTASSPFSRLKNAPVSAISRTGWPSILPVTIGSSPSMLTGSSPSARSLQPSAALAGGAEASAANNNSEMKRTIPLMVEM